MMRRRRYIPEIYLEGISPIACKGNVVHAADGSKVVVQGLDGYIVAEKNGLLLVCSLREEQKIKEFGK